MKAEKVLSVLKEFPAELKFRYTWRAYQARILGEFEKHAEDHHFHVVAAPGSGKTVLGLEVVRRINQPALVLTPNLGIRNQWVARLRELFMPPGYKVDWISHDLSRPRFLTVTTYQALHAFGKKNTYKALVKGLKAVGINTLVFDEAHHLRQEWWKALTEVKKGFSKPFVVALTATPPFDVPPNEWNRYREICGEVDAEVPIPELVMEGNLCPHQDYVYLVRPIGEVRRQMVDFKEHIASFLRDLALNRELIDALLQHRAWKATENRDVEILKNHEYFMSILIFLQHADGVVPPELSAAMGMGGKKINMPPFNRIWAEKMLQGVIFHDRESFAEHEGIVKKLESELYTYKAIERKKIYLMGTPHSNKLLRSSPAKLNGVGDIVQLESGLQGSLMHMVILTDYIREEEFPRLEHESKPMTKLGVAPIFEHLRRLRLEGVRMGILTGSLVVIPDHALPHLHNIAAQMGLPEGEITAAQLWFDPSYLKLSAQGKSAARLVELITRVFSEGFVNLLVGTTALLGEGWDAPTVNTLVLATAIGSYMSSNQMRGRAIRVNPADPDKTANIWHLASVGDDAPGADEVNENDAALLQRRFCSFPGLSVSSNAIGSGLERLDLAACDLTSENLEKVNNRMCGLAEERDLLGKKWKNGLFSTGEAHRGMNYEAFLPNPRRNSREISKYMYKLKEKKGFFGWFYNLLADYCLSIARQRQVKLTRNISKALLQALKEQNLIQTPLSKIGLSVIEGARQVRAVAVGMSNREETIFITALQEIFNPSLMPRYILEKGTNIYCVPKLLGVNKKKAETFRKAWNQQVGSAHLIFTQFPAGRQKLLQAVMRYMVEKSDYETFSRMRWC